MINVYEVFSISMSGLSMSDVKVKPVLWIVELDMAGLWALFFEFLGLWWSDWTLEGAFNATLTASQYNWH
jgi:hypothetical protein